MPCKMEIQCAFIAVLILGLLDVDTGAIEILALVLSHV